MLAMWVEQLLGYAGGALAAIRADEHYPSLMAWARDEGVGYLGGNIAQAQALAPELWNQTPLERLDFACEPLARPGRNEPCWCDSGRKMKHCCGAVSLPGAVPPHLMWMLSLRDWKGDTLKAALESGRAPAQALLEAGLIAAEGGQRGRAQQILETLFQAADWDHLPEQAEPAFELLIELYQERGFNRKRAALLDAILERGPLFLRGVALERLCLMHLDSDDLASAREAFVRAQQTLPDSPTLAYIEAMLLLHEGHPQEARERANFWFRRLARQGDLDGEQLQFLADLADNPGATLAEQMVNSEEALAEPLMGLQALLEALTTAPRLQFEIGDEGTEYHSTAREDTFFAAWREVFGVDVDEEAALGFQADPWPQAGDWLNALCAHPEWLDSPAVVQTLSMALASRFGSLPWMAESFFAPLAARFERWLEQIEAHAAPFVWDVADNAVLLRAGLALVVGMERGDRQRSRRLAERLLVLDENDSLGLRELVLDQLLREGRDSEALALSDQPTGEEEAPLLGVLMGRVLALYRLERFDAAEEALDAVDALNAHVVAMLCADNPRPVPLAVEVPEPGTKAEAWQYRALMRDQWVATRGALQWLAEQRQRLAERSGGR
ncbi:SEC-C domain-containing protein [Modicisalibacter tunisiensis]|uniref:SEC-C domain-containing protein n=1 Tax=Modicisalibacter tunisiensis TaxID=390637 RepID=A0ABS7X3E7_9GAMM|nr:SEC-C domain-containing protein [Modicisalibacter tunisiensis]MBZ9568641.1 SEC-C domain-containing protein [Modicisalibacter tunisiensis]